MVSKNPDNQYKIVFAGGGTAGHIMPGLAIADALLEIGYQKEEILFMGSHKGMEKNLVEKSGFEIKLYSSKGLLREVSLRNMINVLKSCGDNAKSFIFSYSYLRRHRPHVIVMLGGYAGLIPALAGLCLNIPTVVVNVDFAPGLSNRIIGRFAKINTLPAPNPTVRRSIVTGTPLRGDFGGLSNFLLSEKKVDRVSLIEQMIGAKLNLQLDDGIDVESHIQEEDKPRLLILSVISGSLGAYSINKNLPDLAVSLAMDPDMNRYGCRILIYHVTGERDFDKIKQHCLEFEGDKSANRDSFDRQFSFFSRGEKEKKVIFEIRQSKDLPINNKSYADVKYCVVAYEDKVPQLLCITDLFIGRAGASTVAELAALGVASILVPLPNAPRDHQRENIKPLLKEQALLCLDDENLDGENLHRTVAAALLNTGMRQEMASAISKFGRKDAAFTVAELVRSLDVA